MCPAAPSNLYVSKWENIPNWEIVIQTHLLQSIPPHPPCGAEKGPIDVIKYPEPKYIFCPPKSTPRRMKKCETVISRPRNAVSHVVDTCLHAPSTPPNSTPPMSLPRPPIRQPRQATHPTRSLKGPISHPNHSGSHGKYPGLLSFWLVGRLPPRYIDLLGSTQYLMYNSSIYRWWLSLSVVVAIHCHTHIPR